jgi:hypothetical protein
VASELKTSLF